MCKSKYTYTYTYIVYVYVYVYVYASACASASVYVYIYKHIDTYHNCMRICITHTHTNTDCRIPARPILAVAAPFLRAERLENAFGRLRVESASDALRMPNPRLPYMVYKVWPSLNGLGSCLPLMVLRSNVAETLKLELWHADFNRPCRNPEAAEPQSSGICEHILLLRRRRRLQALLLRTANQTKNTLMTPAPSSCITLILLMI